MNSYCSRCCGFPGTHFALPGHFRLLTKHSLISEISGQGFPKGDGYRRTCRVRVSWPRLNPQVLPEREQGLHSLHSPTSQCTKLRKTKKIALVFQSYTISWLLNNLPLRLTLRCALHEFVTGLEVIWADVVAPPAQQVQALTAPHARLTVHAGLAVCRALCKDNHVEVHLSISGVPKSTFQGSGRVFCPAGQKTLPLRKVLR